MERRTNEAPMDFEWERRGPPNPDSPWLKHTRDGAHNFRAQNNFISPSRPQQPPTFGSSSSIFGTPSKKLFQNQTQSQDSIFGTPSRSKTSLFGQNNSSFASAASSSTNLFSSLRKPPGTTEKKDLFGAPTPAAPQPPPSRPHEPDDTDPLPLHGLRLTDTARDILLSSTTPDRTTPGRGELPRIKFPDSSSKRVLKRKPASGISSPRHRPTARTDPASSDSGSDGEYQHHPGQPPRKPKPKSKPLHKPGTSKWDHHFPVLISSYLQLFFNIFIVLVVLYLLTSFLRTIQADVDTKVRQSSQKRLSEIAECQKQWNANRCGAGYVVPAVEGLCREWEVCMQMNPDEVGRAREAARTFAEILNSLVEPISYKAMFFCTVLLFGTLYITNAAFGIYRAKMAIGGHHAHHPTIPQPNIHIPQTPLHPVPTWGVHPAWSMPPLASAAPGIGMGMGAWGGVVGGGDVGGDPQTPSKKKIGWGVGAGGGKREGQGQGCVKKLEG